MCIKQNRVGGLQALYRPEEAPIRDYYGRVWWEGSSCRILYAGEMIHKNRVVQQENTYTGCMVNYGMLDQIFGPLTTIHSSPKVVGTHGVLVFNDECEDPNDVWLAAIAVPVKFFGTGIAQRLMMRFERIVANEGKRSIHLTTRDTMAGYAFARKLGYRATRDGMYRDPSLVMMKKDLLFEKQRRETQRWADQRHWVHA